MKATEKGDMDGDPDVEDKVGTSMRTLWRLVGTICSHLGRPAPRLGSLLSTGSDDVIFKGGHHASGRTDRCG
jgi:hypothetical protein